MIEYIVLVSYPESYWEKELVGFTLPDDLQYPMKLKSALMKQRFNMATDDYDSLQDYADAPFDNVAHELNCTWRHIQYSGFMEINWD